MAVLPHVLLNDLHNTLVRALAAKAGDHFQGLASAARHFKGELSSDTKRRLINIDYAYHLVRHLTEPKVESYITAVLDELTAACDELPDASAKVQRAAAPTPPTSVGDHEESDGHSNSSASVEPKCETDAIATQHVQHAKHSQQYTWKWERFSGRWQRRAHPPSDDTPDEQAGQNVSDKECQTDVNAATGIFIMNETGLVRCAVSVAASKLIQHARRKATEIESSIPIGSNTRGVDIDAIAQGTSGGDESGWGETEALVHLSQERARVTHLLECASAALYHMQVDSGVFVVLEHLHQSIDEFGDSDNDADATMSRAGE